MPNSAINPCDSSINTKAVGEYYRRLLVKSHDPVESIARYVLKWPMQVHYPSNVPHNS